MSVAEILVLVAALLPYGTVAYAKYRAKSTFDNAKPRDRHAFTGAADRAHGAHLNGFETFPLFAIGVLLSELHGIPSVLLTLLATVYVLLRITYIVLYIQNKPTARSSVWSLAFLVSVVIFLLPLLLGVFHVPASYFSS